MREDALHHTPGEDSDDRASAVREVPELVAGFLQEMRENASLLRVKARSMRMSTCVLVVREVCIAGPGYVVHHVYGVAVARAELRAVRKVHEDMRM